MVAVTFEDDWKQMMLLLAHFMRHHDVLEMHVTPGTCEVTRKQTDIFYLD